MSPPEIVSFSAARALEYGTSFDAADDYARPLALISKMKALRRPQDALYGDRRLPSAGAALIAFRALLSAQVLPRDDEPNRAGEVATLFSAAFPPWLFCHFCASIR